MHISLFDFELPEERIALRPVSPRHAAKMLIVQPDETHSLCDASVCDLPSWLKSGDVLVLNNTKVIPARLYGVRWRGKVQAKIEILLHMRLSGYEWKTFARPAKKLQQGDVIAFTNISVPDVALRAHVMEKGEEGEVTLRFEMSGAELDQALVHIGEMPLPPYIAGKRKTDEQDASDYQTVYAKHEGAVAAPTAGLHFTPELIKALEESGIKRYFVTLHVGAGTFLPVKVEDTRDHKMHAEWGHVDMETASALNAVKASGGRIVAVGTTSLRLLESACDEHGVIQPFHDATQIFITPSYHFKAVDILMTNFHLPKSTLFMLVSAFCGLEMMQQAYAHAIKSGYRFYSYGDSSLLFRNACS
jgi:S-adenosylmethionine:tRNA ribosyltransferase-isomerase